MGCTSSPVKVHRYSDYRHERRLPAVRQQPVEVGLVAHGVPDGAKDTGLRKASPLRRGGDD